MNEKQEDIGGEYVGDDDTSSIHYNTGKLKLV